MWAELKNKCWGCFGTQSVVSQPLQGLWISSKWSRPLIFIHSLDMVKAYILAGLVYIISVSPASHCPLK